MVIVKRLGLGLGMGYWNGEWEIGMEIESTPSIQQKNDQVDSDNNNMGESNMIKEKVINNPLHLGE